MIILNGKKFAQNDKEFSESLFDPTGTCVGFYRRYKCSVVLFNPQRQRIGAINRHRVLCKATPSDGGYRYSYGTIPEIGEYESYAAEQEEMASVLAGN